MLNTQSLFPRPLHCFFTSTHLSTATYEPAQFHSEFGIDPVKLCTEERRKEFVETHKNYAHKFNLKDQMARVFIIHRNCWPEFPKYENISIPNINTFNQYANGTIRDEMNQVPHSLVVKHYGQRYLDSFFFEDRIVWIHSHIPPFGEGTEFVMGYKHYHPKFEIDHYRRIVPDTFNYVPCRIKVKIARGEGPIAYVEPIHTQLELTQEIQKYKRVCEMVRHIPQIQNVYSEFPNLQCTM